MEMTQLAGELARWLAPALPLLKDLGSEAAEAGGKALVGKAWEAVKAVWGKLSGKVAERPAAVEAVEDVAKNPEDARARGALELQLEKILTAEPALAGELARLLEAVGERAHYQGYVSGSGALAQGPGAVAAGAGGVAIGGHARVGPAGESGKDPRWRSGDE